MILTRLKEYADTRMELPPVMYGEVPVRWFVELDLDGTLLGFTSRGGDKTTNRRGEPLLVPRQNVNRTRNTKPKLLVDNGEYALAVSKADSDEAKIPERHQSFVELTLRCAEDTKAPSVESVTKFLEWWSPERTELLPEGFDPAHDLTFRVNGVLPLDLESVREFWIRESARPNSKVTTCLVTGEEKIVQDRMPVSVKGLARIGGQSSGTLLVSADKPAFYSYGLKNSLTSPISVDAAERFGNALNNLLASEESSIYIGTTAYVFWTRKETGFNYLGFVEQPKPEAVKLLFESVFSGRETSEVRANNFYALALSASKTRAVVRDWLETTVMEVEDKLCQWFEEQKIVSSYGEHDDHYLGVRALARATVQREGESNRDAEQRVQPALVASLMRAALKGGRLPEDILARVIRRNRAEGDVTRPRAALIKLLFSRLSAAGRQYPI